LSAGVSDFRSAGRIEIILGMAGTLAGNGGRPLQTLQEICCDPKATETTNRVSEFGQWFARFSPPVKKPFADNFFIRHQHGRILDRPCASHCTK
jgi:hypothetical protein